MPEVLLATIHLGEGVNRIMATTKKKTKETKGKPLESMNLKELQREYHLVFGLETTSTSKESVRKKIAGRRSELAQERAARRAEANVERDPRLPEVGTVLVREHNGKKHRGRDEGNDRGCGARRRAATRADDAATDP